MEFLIVFVISFVVLLGVASALAFGKAPTYRPSRQEILALLVDVMDKRASIERWEMFLSLPINHDPELENIRRECLGLVDSNDGRFKEGLDGAILDKATMTELRSITAGLHQLVISAPSSKAF